VMKIEVKDLEVRKTVMPDNRWGEMEIVVKHLPSGVSVLIPTRGSHVKAELLAVTLIELALEEGVTR